ncbi:60s acidic ribosomal protein-domain-containing protein [Leucosporidium creatinivorum]|uniref:60s acidic ribosomal protein-domain-containing protein n=1 Tax=Leucosporidium creatinivorum TaxID=106004 RepID=A0A1Y2G4L1_9BASI|nr:60s acidic ribosomal protein-domain-containing protein [Leucosporidium creatinivorum]
MKHVAAYLLLVSGGNASPSAADVTELLATVDITPDAERLEKLISELSGKDINELIAEGTAKLASVPSGGAAAPAAAAAGGAAPAAAAEAEKPKEEEKEESDDDMG